MQFSKKRRIVVLIILSLVCGMVYLTPFLRFTFYDQMIVALGINHVQLGIIGATYGLFNVLGYIPSGFLSEKFSTKTMLIVSLSGMLASTIWYCTFPPFEHLVVIHALYGIFSVGTFWSSYLKSIRALGSDAEQSRMFGASEGIRGLGNFVFSFIFLGIMGAFAQVVIGFGALLWVNAAIFAILLVAVIVAIPNFDKKVSKKRAASQTGENVGTVALSSGAILIKMVKMLARPGVWVCIFVIMCGYACWNTVNGYMGTYCTVVLGVPEAWSSALAIVRSYLIVFIAGITGGIIMDRFRSKGVGMMCAFAGVAIFTALVFITGVPLEESFIMGIICLIITLLVAYMANVLKSTYWSILGDAGIKREDTGTATAVISLIGLTPDIFVPAVIGSILNSYSTFDAAGNILSTDVMGYNLMLLWLFVWGILGIFFSLVLKKYKTHLDKKNGAEVIAEGA